MPKHLTRWLWSGFHLLLSTPITSFARSAIIIGIESQNLTVSFRNTECLITLARNVVANVYHVLLFSLTWEVLGQTVWNRFLVIAVFFERFLGKRLFMHSAATSTNVILVTWDGDIICTSSDSDLNILAHSWITRTLGNHDHFNVAAVNRFRFSYSRRMSEDVCLRRGTDELHK